MVASVTNPRRLGAAVHRDAAVDGGVESLRTTVAAPTQPPKYSTSVAAPASPAGMLRWTCVDGGTWKVERARTPYNPRLTD